jgi:hypothetical protein
MKQATMTITATAMPLLGISHLFIVAAPQHRAWRKHSSPTYSRTGPSTIAGDIRRAALLHGSAAGRSQPPASAFM